MRKRKNKILKDFIFSFPHSSVLNYSAASALLITRQDAKMRSGVHICEKEKIKSSRILFFHFRTPPSLIILPRRLSFYDGV